MKTNKTNESKIETTASLPLAGQLEIKADGKISEVDINAIVSDSERAKACEVASERILAVMGSEKGSWVAVYRLLEAVDSKELWRPAFHSFTAWARSLAERGGFPLRELWRYRKAGRYYEEYAERCRKRGKSVPELENADNTYIGQLSPRNFERIDKIAEGNVRTRDRLISRMLSGKLRAPELESIWKAKKASGAHVRTSRHDEYTAQNDDAETPKMTAEAVVEAITCASDGEWLPVRKKHLPGMRYKYKVMTEVPCHTGSTDRPARIDALIAETYGVDQVDEVLLHAIEIKVSKSDLLRDVKMGEYADFADYMYLCVPDDPELLQLAESHVDELQGSQQWGILAVRWDTEKNDSGADATARPALRVVRRPERLPGVMRDKTLAYLVQKLI